MDAITPPKPKVLVEGEPFIPYVKEENFDPRLKPLFLTEEDIRNLLAFMKTLSAPVVSYQGMGEETTRATK